MSPTSYQLLYSAVSMSWGFPLDCSHIIVQSHKKSKVFFEKEGKRDMKRTMGIVM